MQGQLTAPGRRGRLSSTPNADLSAMLEAAGATSVLAPVLDVRAEAMLQRRTLTELAGPIAELAQTATPEQRPHLRSLITAVRRLAGTNDRIDAGTATIAGLVDPITSVHEFTRTIRPLLAALYVPGKEDGKAAQLRELHAVFTRTVPRTRNAFSLRPLLGVTRYTQLVDELAAWTHLQATTEGLR